MNTQPRCPRCGAEMPPDAAYGVCPRCLLQPAPSLLDAPPYPPQETPTFAASGQRPAGGRFVAPEPAELADHFPQLEILQLVGQGGMGAVYKARQRGLDRIVALKILPPSAADDPRFAERFHREARALARLNHPHIVAVYDSGLAGPYYYLLMEFVDGVNLRQAMLAGRIQPSQTLEMITQICDALQYAHNERVVHRDIKPENVLIDQRGQIKVADFGLAKMIDPELGDSLLTGTHQVMGTPRYMAPEQLEGARDVDHRADIFSLGVVFYELLTGELPLGRFAPPSRKVQVDVRLDEVVLRTLEKQPDLRYQQASQLKTDVESIRTGTPATAIGPAPGGYEFRSAASIFGIPLVHVAYGRDPATGRRRIAKGLVAIGDIAIGLLAIGGCACGGLAIGGLALGVLALGGLAVAGLALGGGSLGFLSLGGLAVGYVAVGGVAIGVEPFGGAMVYLGDRPKPPAPIIAYDTMPRGQEWENPMSGQPPLPPQAPSAPNGVPAQPVREYAVTSPRWLIILLVLFGAPVGLVLGILTIVWIVVARGRRQPVEHLGGPPQYAPPKDNPPPQSSSIGCAIAAILLAVFGVLAVLAAIVVGAYLFSSTSSPPNPPAVRIEEQAMPSLEPPLSERFTPPTQPDSSRP